MAGASSAGKWKVTEGGWKPPEGAADTPTALVDRAANGPLTISIDPRVPSPAPARASPPEGTGWDTREASEAAGRAGEGLGKVREGTRKASEDAPPSPKSGNAAKPSLSAAASTAPPPLSPGAVPAVASTALPSSSLENSRPCIAAPARRRRDLASRRERLFLCCHPSAARANPPSSRASHSSTFSACSARPSIPGASISSGRVCAARRARARCRRCRRLLDRFRCRILSSAPAPAPAVRTARRHRATAPTARRLCAAPARTPAPGAVAYRAWRARRRLAAAASSNCARRHRMRLSARPAGGAALADDKGDWSSGPTNP